MRSLASLAFVFALSLAGVPHAFAHGAGETPIGFDERPGAAVPTGLRFRDDAGRGLRLAAALDGKPVVLVLGYTTCRDLCATTLVGVAEALRRAHLVPGRDYDPLYASIDPHDAPAALARAKAERLPPGERATWRFLQGEGDAAARLAQAVGFVYRTDRDGQGYEHPAGFVVLTPDGHVSRYFEGVRFDPDAVADAVHDAARGRTGTLGERLLLLCSHLDPTTGRHTATILAILRILVVMCAAALGATWWWSRRRHARTRP